MSLPLGTLMMKARSAGEVGVLVSREASPQVLVHGNAWGLFTCRPMPPHVRRTFRAKGWNCYWTSQTKHAACRPRSWRMETPRAWACGSSWALAANSHTSAHIWPKRHGNFPMASSGAGAKAQAQDTNLQAGFLGTTPGQALRAC